MLDKQLDCEGIDISAEKGKVNIIELEELVPYMNETPITDQSFIDCKFERIDVTVEESGDESFHYYVYEFGGTYDPSLISAKNFTGVQLFNEEYKTWHTEGELQMLFMLFLKEEGETVKWTTHPALYDKAEIKKYGEKKYQEYKDSLSKDDKEYLENKYGKMK
jgi:hypothetical protein